ncbi:MAG TPA: polysaccharide deacetylase family protein [Syntrophales bacterium]|nr:polysaccharide deacetylase family protein [Syntrophales bacterium]
MKNSRPFISFTFDDCPTSSYYTGGSILKKYGLTGTYYVSLGLIGQDSPVGKIFSQEDLKKILADNHELGCHTFDHLHSWDVKADLFEDSLLKNQRALESILPDARFTTFSYPKSDPNPQTKLRAGRHFLCCRGGSKWTNNTDIIDLNLLNSCMLDSRTMDNDSFIKGLIDKNNHTCGWLIFVTHDVTINPSPFGCTPNFFEDIVCYSVNTGSIILPVMKTCQALDIV